MRPQPLRVIPCALLLIAWLLPLAAGASDLDTFVAELKAIFPDMQRAGDLEGEPPSAVVYGPGRILGYALLTADITKIPAYSGKLINALVGFDAKGVIRGVRIVEHQEPILVYLTVCPKYGGRPSAGRIRAQAAVGDFCRCIDPL